MEIKTLSEILAESDADSASNSPAQLKKSSKANKHASDKPNKQHEKTNAVAKEQPIYNDGSIDTKSKNSSASNNQTTSKPKRRKKRKKTFHPAANFTADNNDTPTYKPPEAQNIKEMLAEVKQNIHGVHGDSDNQATLAVTSSQQDPETSKSSSKPTIDDDASSSDNLPNDNLPAALKAYLRTPEQRQAEIDAIKAESRLRWLAFYYLSRREYGRDELKQKLVDKKQDPIKIDALLDEFAEKGYQSDYRTTLMLIRENIRKGRGRGRIKQEFYRKKIAMPSNIDELIDMANTEADEFSEFVDDSEDNLVEGVDWLKLAVTARTKKYGDDIPIEAKDKARQLRFLQYRGFQSDICFAALNHTLGTLDERF
ncbi:regulatory protein RecX [Psychrobacter sp.]|uniref:regulatory protein RecX n=1 Tax=Psychrobacter sp. TaxID=56811 RepID=UPI0026480DDD|nr:regulatory protein RecX [Psychrobacter sp.]MDN6275523.1 recombination regulator RecX [Psychrobacter sp.]MDN6308775.1 recombination regulator RecX [Psychrobacter sp.]